MHVLPATVIISVTRIFNRFIKAETRGGLAVGLKTQPKPALSEV
jgi:hypothetical protein